jgi:hypothetical protein
MSWTTPQSAHLRKTAMLVENAIKRILSVPDSWVRVEQVAKIRGGLKLCLGIHRGRRGKTAATWSIECLGVHEAKITDFDGGGLALYASHHPAAKQYIARWSELRWARDSNPAVVLATMYQAHIGVVHDWIPFEQYALPNMPYTRGFRPRSGKEFGCRGPGFLIRAYAQALRKSGVNVRVFPLKVGGKRSSRPRVLHFGTSYVVAEAFTAEHHNGHASES